GRRVQKRENRAPAPPRLSTAFGQESEHLRGVGHPFGFCNQIGPARFVIQQVSEPGQYAGFGREVCVDGLWCYTRLLRDAPDWCARVSALGEQLACRREYCAQGQRFAAIAQSDDTEPVGRHSTSLRISF